MIGISYSLVIYRMLFLGYNAYNRISSDSSGKQKF